MSRILKAAVLAVALGLPAQGAMAQDFNAGADAYDAGDYAAALKEWRPLAEAGDAGTQFMLGWMYADGKGTAQDYAEAVRWLRRSAAQGDPRGQVYLGQMYDKGTGVTKDYVEAVRWYRKAAAQGDPRGQAYLGKMYDSGTGVIKDNAEAVRLYRKAAEQGYFKAQFALGRMYLNGNGVLQDYITAHMWMNIAAATGAPFAKDGRDAVAALLSPQDLTRAQQMARACVAQQYKDS
ncbi:tetratricopeptide repeat protein [Mameliella alba]|uniref:tetratricopeptide repeat protein n=1 Tax=Mameliella alba TaxID=561184 RepID=UPI0014316A27|nr:tetratricopeptide repeat protein [Mameliella alba]